MAQKKTTEEATTAPVAEAASSRDPRVLVNKVTANLKPEVARAALATGVAKGQERTIAVVERAVATVDRVAPAKARPVVVNVRKAITANIDLAVKVAQAQIEFASKIAKTVAPAS